MNCYLEINNYIKNGIKEPDIQNMFYLMVIFFYLFYHKIQSFEGEK